MPRITAVLIASTMGTAFAAIFVRWALPVPPVVTACYRMAIAALGLAAWFAIRRRSPALPRGAAPFAVAAGVLFAADIGLWQTALVHTSVANATLLVNTTPIHVGLYTLLVLRERLEPRFLLGALLALAGTATLLFDQLGRGEGLRGELLALAGGVFWAGYLIVVVEARRRAGAVATMLWANVSAASVLGLAALALDLPFTGFPARSWAAVVAIAVVSQLMASLGIVWALRYARATFASVALLAQPAGTAVLGWWLLDEPLGPLQALGGIAVLGGILLGAGRGAQPTPLPGRTR